MDDTSTAQSQPDIVCTDSRIVYENRWMKVREDAIRRSDGSTGIFGVIDKGDFVIVVPFDGERLHLVEQFRYPIGSRELEFPQGGWEDRPDADREEVAHGELREETGLTAAQMDRIGRLFPLYGTVAQSYTIFLATGLTAGAAQLDPEEQDLISRALPVADVERMILAGEIRDAGTVAAFGLLRMKGLL